MKKISSLILALALSLGLMACSGKTEYYADPDTPAVSLADQPGAGGAAALPGVPVEPAAVRDLMDGLTVETEGVDTENIEPGAAAVSGLAVLLLQNEMGKENPLISPFSVAAALGMVMNGAEGETLAQMCAVLGAVPDELNGYFCVLGSDEHLHAANAIWYNESRADFTPDPDFLVKDLTYYNADARAVVFDAAGQAAINAWVAEKTDGMIDSIIEELDPHSVMVLANALSFEAEWEEPYFDYSIGDGTFTAASGDKRSVTMMYSRENAYIRDDGAQGFIKYYADSDYAFAVLLPDAEVGLDDYITCLNAGTLSRVLGDVQWANVDAAMPKFTVDYSKELSESLISLGMELAFDPNLAEFDAMSIDDNDLYIEKVYHKTHIEVGEQGTRAGAATAVVMNDTCVAMAEGELIEITLDRPFLYMIIDCRTNTPIFIGAATDIGE